MTQPAEPQGELHVPSSAPDSSKKGFEEAELIRLYGHQYQRDINRIRNWTGELSYPNMRRWKITVYVSWGIITLVAWLGLMLLIDSQAFSDPNGLINNTGFLISSIITPFVFSGLYMSGVPSKIVNIPLIRWEEKCQALRNQAIEELAKRNPREHAAWQTCVIAYTTQENRDALSQGTKTFLEVVIEEEAAYFEFQGNSKEEQIREIRRYFNYAKKEGTEHLIPSRTIKTSPSDLLSALNTICPALDQITQENKQILATRLANIKEERQVRMRNTEVTSTPARKDIEEQLAKRPVTVDTSTLIMDELPDDVVRFRSGALMRNSDRLEGIRILDLAHKYKTQARAIKTWEGNPPHEYIMDDRKRLIKTLWAIILIALVFGFVMLTSPETFAQMQDFKHRDPRWAPIGWPALVGVVLWSVGPLLKPYKWLVNQPITKWEKDTQTKRDLALTELPIRYPEEYSAWRELVELEAEERAEEDIQSGKKTALEAETEKESRRQAREEEILTHRKIRDQRILDQARAEQSTQIPSFSIPNASDADPHLLSTQDAPQHRTSTSTRLSETLLPLTPAIQALDEIEADLKKKATEQDKPSS